MHKQSISIIIPPSSFLLDERVFVNLGALLVAGSLEHKGFPVSLLDLSGSVAMLNEITEHLAAHPATLFFGFSATTAQMPETLLLANQIRKLRPESRLILGGAHATLIHAAWKKQPTGRAQQGMQSLMDVFNVIVAGDGELAIHEAMEHSGESFCHIIDADNRKSAYFLPAAQLEALPLPARHLIDLKSYRYTIDGENATSLVGQRGCPFACRFCGGRHTAMLRGMRSRTVNSILHEVEHLFKTYGYKGFMFYDDELNVNPHFEALLRGLTQLQDRLGADFRIRGFVKSELFTSEQARLMYEAGFRWLLPGFESGSPRMLKNMGKTATVTDNSRCVELAKQHGLKVKALMCLGRPGESPESIQESVDWLLRIQPDELDMTVVTIYPGTAYHDNSTPLQNTPDVWVYTAPETGDKLYSKTIDYTKDAYFFKGKSRDEYKAFVYTDYFTTEQLVSARDEAEQQVRAKLGIISPIDAVTKHIEHSMGAEA